MTLSRTWSVGSVCLWVVKLAPPCVSWVVIISFVWGGIIACFLRGGIAQIGGIRIKSWWDLTDWWYMNEIMVGPLRLVAYQLNHGWISQIGGISINHGGS
eukprot:769906_1